MRKELIPVGVIGSGTMGSGIAQLASTYGHNVYVYDTNSSAIDKAKQNLQSILQRQVEKGRMEMARVEEILGRIKFIDDFSSFSKTELVIEAIVEDLDIKNKVFTELESTVAPGAIIATNTSSLSVASLSASLKERGRFLGIHFFNPAPLMPLVEIVPGMQTNSKITEKAREVIDSWGKTTVIAKDTPGFIVNRVARPFYGEALRIFEEGLADAATIDWAMREIGGFRMGPFQLMDYIGNDINFTVTETVFKEFFYDPRFKPALTQKRMVEAGLLGKKTGKGYYNYGSDAEQVKPNEDKSLGEEILNRILAMLINEACDAVFMNVATAKDVDLAMTKGVNYPKGLLAWADEIGLEKVLERLTALQEQYSEDRYRPNPLLKKMVQENKTFSELM